MLEPLIVVVRALALALRGQPELVPENLALRQQRAAFHRTKRCRIRTGDRLFYGSPAGAMAGRLVGELLPMLFELLACEMCASIDAAA